MFAFKLLTPSIAGRIYEDKMIWQPLYQHPPTVLIATGEDRICMELEGAKHGGIVAYSASSARMLINWSDGYLDWKVMGEKTRSPIKWFWHQKRYNLLSSCLCYGPSLL